MSYFGKDTLVVCSLAVCLLLASCGVQQPTGSELVLGLDLPEQGTENVVVSSSSPTSSGMSTTEQNMAESVMAVLDGRSFRILEPHKNASPRKALVIDFFDGASVWAQYAEDGHAVDEWEIAAQDTEVVYNTLTQEAVILLVNPRTQQQFPYECMDCLNTNFFSISVLNPFDAETIGFKINDPTGSLPSPFPMAERWTRFQEDIYYE